MNEKKANSAARNVRETLIINFHPKLDEHDTKVHSHIPLLEHEH